MISFICCAREANINASSAYGDRPAVLLSRITPRIFSPVAVPPGSLVVTTEIDWLRRTTANFSSWVLLPQPSSPSKVINRPREERDMTRIIAKERQNSRPHQTAGECFCYSVYTISAQSILGFLQMKMDMKLG